MKTNFIKKIKHSVLGHATKGNITLLMVGLIMIVPVSSCKKSFLDVVPDNVSTIANAFVSKTEAEKYLFTCYSYLPTETDPTYNVGLTAGDEVWVEDPANHIRSTKRTATAKRLPKLVGPYCQLYERHQGRSGKLQSHTRL
ncbi:hypothetical protein ACFJIV_14655 [Mucilaginibacter sp. UC70_90]